MGGVRGRQYVYKLLWEEKYGPVPKGKKLHHKCENKWCIELTHLEPLTQSEHVKKHEFGGDWGQAAKTHCPQGHRYSKKNTYIYTTPSGRTERYCRKCRRAAKRRQSGT